MTKHMLNNKNFASHGAWQLEAARKRVAVVQLLMGYAHKYGIAGSLGTDGIWSIYRRVPKGITLSLETDEGTKISAHELM